MGGRVWVQAVIERPDTSGQYADNMGQPSETKDPARQPTLADLVGLEDVQKALVVLGYTWSIPD